MFMQMISIRDHLTINKFLHLSDNHCFYLSTLIFFLLQTQKFISIMTMSSLKVGCQMVGRVVKISFPFYNLET